MSIIADKMAPEIRPKVSTVFFIDRILLNVEGDERLAVWPFRRLPASPKWMILGRNLQNHAFRG
jgi:hypothetical protein